MTTNHTPTPWTTDDAVDGDEYGYIMADADSPYATFIARYGRPHREVDAAHIVCCVNAHDELVSIVRRVAEHFADTDAPLGVDASAALAKVTP